MDASSDVVVRHNSPIKGNGISLETTDSTGMS